MTQVLFALIFGIIAGALDAFPMLKKGVPKPSILCIFFQWVLLGVIIPFVSWNMPPTLKGLILGVLGMVPIGFLLFYRNKSAILPTLLAGAALGAGLGAASALYL